ncbi:putative P-type ATPase, subfamily IV, HAD superfamily [Plasmopara halstedii]
MIQTAHVGVGISGNEGVQAVNASDYAIAQFRFLTRLVLLHGRCNYKRICMVIRYSFYKNIALVICLFTFNFYNGQSGTPLFESFVMAGWNFFLALPIIVIGIYDQDISEEIILKYPQLYRYGQYDSDLNMHKFSTTIINAIGHALVCFFVCYGCMQYTNYGLYVIGTLFYAALLGTMKLKVTILTQVWNKYHFAVMTFSIWLFIFFLLVYPHMTFMGYDMYGVPVYMIQLQRFWTLLLLCPVAAVMFDFILLAAQQQFRPRAEDILRERSRTAKSKRVSDFVEPIPQIESPSTDNIFMVEHSTNENARCDATENKLVMAKPSFPNRRASIPSTYDSLKGSLPELQSLSSFAFNGLDQTMGAQASRGPSAQETVTMRVLSFQMQRRPNQTDAINSFVAPE